MRRWMPSLVLVLLVSACQFGGQPAATDIPTVPPASVNPTSVSAATTAATLAATTASVASAPTTAPTKRSAAANTAVPPNAAPTTPIATNNNSASATSGNPRVLAWDRDGKQAAWFAATGQPQKVVDGAASRVLLCGLNPPDGLLVLYHGEAVAQPQLVNLNGQAPLSLGDGSALACDISGRTTFSPDTNKLAFIKYASNATTAADFTSGALRILKVADGSELASIDNVTAFNLQNDGALFLNFFANSKGDADRADLAWWDAATNKKTVLEQNFQALDNCFFTSGRVLRVADKVYTSLGERCTKPIGSVYRILRTDFAGGHSINFVDKTNAGGKYWTNTNTNDLFLTPDGKSLLFLYPNGQSTEVANLVRVSLDTGKPTQVIAGVVTDQSPQSLGRRWLLSPDGTQLAFITRSANGGETLYLYDLNHPEALPAAITGSTRSNRVNGIAWNAASDRIAFITTGDDQSLNTFDLKTGSKKLVVRGLFQGLALSPNGAFAAMSEQVQADTNDLRNNLVEVALADGTKTVLVNGGKGGAALVPLAVR